MYRRCAAKFFTSHYLLFQLKDNAQARRWSDTIRSLAIPNGPIDQFKDALERLASKLNPTGGIKKVGKALSWYFDKDEIVAILSLIEIGKLGTNLRLLVTGREHVESILLESFPEAKRIDIRTNNEDIGKFVDGRIKIEQNLKRYVGQDVKLRDSN